MNGVSEEIDRALRWPPGLAALRPAARCLLAAKAQILPTTLVTHVTSPEATETWKQLGPCGTESSRNPPRWSDKGGSASRLEIRRPRSGRFPLLFSLLARRFHSLLDSAGFPGSIELGSL